jgi:hypothetical protein
VRERSPSVKPCVTVRLAVVVLLALLAGVGCGAPGSVPAQPTWADVAPILRGECVSCHGWTASDRPADAVGVHPQNSGGSIRLDFYDVTAATCGDAARALDPSVSLAGSALATLQMKEDITTPAGARWPRMPPQPSPALPSWEIETIARWTADPVKGPPPASNRPPTITASQLPSVADQVLAFTAVLDDPDGDAALGAIEVGDVACLMNRSGSFAVRLDSSAWSAGTVHPTAIVCDGWTSATIDLGPIEIRH